MTLKAPYYKKLLFLLVILFSIAFKIQSQPCGVSQSLSPMQQSFIAPLISQLDTALKYEDAFLIDSLSTEIKAVFSSQGGIPESIETYYPLVSNTNWPDMPDALVLSRALIANDSMVYAELWKTAKGMKPPLYQPHSLFLRTAADMATGLLKIAAHETDMSRKALYQLWARTALDSLASMQLPSGAFPFPDLRAYGDPVFSSIIQNFLDWCGPDSVNVLQNGWIIDDKGTGEFKFDAGLIANAYFEAYQLTGDTSYRNIVITVGNYLMPLHFSRNYNYNTFVSLGLTRAFQLTYDTSYLNRAIMNLRYAVMPGQMDNGRWVDGHNASSRYHSIIIQNSAPTIQLLPANQIYKSTLETMAVKAVRNLSVYTFSCNSATGFAWLIKAYTLPNSVITSSLKDSISHLIGQHVNQAAVNGKYLDVPVMGAYLELLQSLTGIHSQNFVSSIEINAFPNPTNGLTQIVYSIPEATYIDISLLDINGKHLVSIDKGHKTAGTYNCRADLSPYPKGIYLLLIRTDNSLITKMLIKF